MSFNKYFTKENVEFYLKELAKEYKKENKHGPMIEVILVGGASILLNYGFRETTTDLDSIIRGTSSLKNAINRVGDKYNLPNGWLNSDFLYTSSNSSRLVEHSKYYKTFYNAIEVRTITAEYLIAMKLMAGRSYKKDMSDIVGIIKEQYENKKPINIENINKAVIELYGNWDSIDSDMIELLEQAISSESIDKLYNNILEEEQKNKVALLKAENKYKAVINEDNLQNFIDFFTDKDKSE